MPAKRRGFEWSGFFESRTNARRDRSAVESLMLTIKDGFEFGEMRHRGIDVVRSELMEKVPAYNCCRTDEVSPKKVKAQGKDGHRRTKSVQRARNSPPEATLNPEP